MRIASRIFAVGAIPIVIAAGIALAAILLLTEANNARSRAILAGTVFRTLLTAVNVRNDFLQASPEDRPGHATHFVRVAARAQSDLARLRNQGRGQDRTTLGLGNTLAEFMSSMDQLVAVTARNDQLTASMAARAASLIALTDQARARQHASNADIVTSLQDGDRKLREARDVVDAAVTLRVIVAALQSGRLDLQGSAQADAQTPARRGLRFDVTRVQHATADLTALLQAKNKDQPAGTDGSIQTRIGSLLSKTGSTEPFVWSTEDTALVDELARWTEQLLKVNSAEYRSFHDEASQLFTYSVQAHETELATQNIAIATLKLSGRAAEALSRRDEAAARAIFEESSTLPGSIAAQPISPLIQTEMVEAAKRWREGLGATIEGLSLQNGLLKGMDEAATTMIDSARSIDTTFSRNAEDRGRSVGFILILGAATGLLLGAGAAFVVARSITQPLRQLQFRMMQLAADPEGSSVPDSARNDELGDMARATKRFLVEISRRERAINKAKERADAALETLQRTQAELIQVEKLASLGQLVAGIAHEINTPIGIALTTSTVIDEETQQFRTGTSDGRITRSALNRFVDRVGEGSQMLSANLARAADLIQSFKHVAADQVSGEQRLFDVQNWLQQLITSLGPMMRKTGHVVTVDCVPGLMLDTLPGALAQVITNLIVNASLHAFDKGQAGEISVAIHENGPDMYRFVIRDNGRGIAAENRGRIFDPFFTTRRAEGSTGLGLHIVFNLVTSTLQGRIYFESKPGGGTAFTIDLPRTLKLAVSKPTLQHALQA